jgi:hypothetical protein
MTAPRLSKDEALMTNDPYPTILPVGLGIVLSLALNFGAPAVAWLLSDKLKRHRWWPHLVVCFWEIISIWVFVILLLPELPADEAPGPRGRFHINSDAAFRRSSPSRLLHSVAVEISKLHVHSGVRAASVDDPFISNVAFWHF